MNDEVVYHQNDLLPVILSRLGHRLHELFHKGTKSGAVLVLFDAMQSLARNVVDGAEAVALLVDSWGHHLALVTLHGPTAQNTGQEVEINLVLEEQQDFSIFRRFFIL